MWQSLASGRLGNGADARLGALMVIAGQLIGLPTVLATPLQPGQRVGMLVMSALNPVVSVALVRFLPWERLNRRVLMLWPAWTIIGLALAGTRTFANGAPTLAGLFVLSFFYIGLTQPRGTALACLPVAFPCWVATYGGWHSELLLRAPITVGVWILVGETIARLRHQLGKLTDDLVRDASTDALTGLANRRALGDTIASLLPGDAVVLLDLDRFKLLNDQFGHEAGDKVLSELGDCIRAVVRPGDTAMRLGGEEMMLVLRGADESGAREVLARLTGHWATTQPGVTFSAGVVVVGDVAAEDAVATADTALYRAKLDGRNRSAFANSGASAAARR